MSETIGSPLSGNPTGGAHPSTSGPAGRSHAPVETVREAYSFACLHCAYGWEQEYTIEHHIARDGSTVFEYFANGVRVPSPLLRPVCPGCGGNNVRIMRAGRVATAEHSLNPAPGFAPHAEPAGPAPTVAVPTERARPEKPPTPRRRRFLPFHHGNGDS